MVNDTLTGNLLMKVFSSYTTGGGFEALGYGYGPGIGEGYERLVLIISRASGFPVIANAMSYAGQLVKGNIMDVAKKEFEKVNKAGLKAILEKVTASSSKKSESSEEVKCPPEEQATATISGIDILELEDAKVMLWKNNIFAKTGMGCTGPVVMVNDSNLEKSKEILEKEGFV